MADAPPLTPARGAAAGVGIGWRPEIAGWVAQLPALGFCEVIAESLRPAVPPRGVAELRERGVAVVPHGVRLSLGGAEPVAAARVTHLAACATALDAPLVSEHVAFVRAGGRDAGHLLPVPRTRAALDVLTANVRRLQAELDVPLALEPIAALFDWPDDEYTEPDFLTELLERTGALLLLDVANVDANARNRGQDARAVLDRMPLDRVAYVHVAGGSEHDGYYHDTHTDAVAPAVLALLERLVERSAGPPPVMLERDGRYPPAAVLRAELDAVAAAAGLPWPPPAEVAFSDPARTAMNSGVSPGLGYPSTPTRVPFHPDSRDGHPDLAERQVELVAALVAGGPQPTGFDPDRLAATRRALLRKRAGEAAKAWPLLAASLGAGWRAFFARERDGHEPVGALRDGWDVARVLRGRGELGPGARTELAEREAALRYDGRGDPRPRLRTRARRVFASRRQRG